MSKRIVILTGAGISAESGIKTFRDAGGLWEDHRVEQVATPEGFAADPALVQRFYNLRRAALRTVKPNAAHIALAKLQAEMSARGGEILIITQNVDDLHERGGAKHVLHMHGELKRVFCTACNYHAACDHDINPATPCTACRTVGATRPDIVWFGEIPHHMDAIDLALARCDLFVSIGTSGAVYPAAGFVRVAKHYGAKTLELNLEPSEGSLYFDETRIGKAGNIVPAWVKSVLSEPA